MTVVLSNRCLRTDTSQQAVDAMAEYLAHGPADDTGPADIIRCRAAECHGEKFPCRRRTAIENWLFVPRESPPFTRGEVVYRKPVPHPTTPRREQYATAGQRRDYR